jgi:hypothetical protein
VTADGVISLRPAADGKLSAVAATAAFAAGLVYAARDDEEERRKLPRAGRGARRR